MHSPISTLRKKSWGGGEKTIKVNGLIFFLFAGHEKLGYEHAFQPYAYSLRPYSGGRQTPPPRLYIDLDPPALIGLTALLLKLELMPLASAIRIYQNYNKHQLNSIPVMLVFL